MKNKFVLFIIILFLIIIPQSFGTDFLQLEQQEYCNQVITLKHSFNEDVYEMAETCADNMYVDFSSCMELFDTIEIFNNLGFTEKYNNCVSDYGFLENMTDEIEMKIIYIRIDDDAIATRLKKIVDDINL